MSYQGYSNYPTWAVCLWLDNDEALYHEAREIVARRRGWRGAGGWQRLAGDDLESWIGEMAPKVEGLFADLLTHALGEVDWAEVAASRIDEDETDESNDDDEAVPPCAASMGCLCAGHARGDDANAACDMREVG